MLVAAQPRRNQDLFRPQWESLSTKNSLLAQCSIYVLDMQRQPSDSSTASTSRLRRYTSRLRKIGVKSEKGGPVVSCYMNLDLMILLTTY